MNYAIPTSGRLRWADEPRVTARLRGPAGRDKRTRRTLYARLAWLAVIVGVGALAGPPLLHRIEQSIVAGVGASGPAAATERGVLPGAMGNAAGLLGAHHEQLEAANRALDGQPAIQPRPANEERR